MNIRLCYLHQSYSLIAFDRHMYAESLTVEWCVHMEFKNSVYTTFDGISHYRQSTSVSPCAVDIISLSLAVVCPSSTVSHP